MTLLDDPAQQPAAAASRRPPAGQYRRLRPARLGSALPARLWLRTGGAAILVSAGYVDPGNWGTDLAAGAQFGMRLVWVLAVATVLALFLQQLSARLGLGSGADLAQLIRQRCSPVLRWLLTPPILLALAITEIVEVLGVIVGVQLLTGLPASAAIAIAAVLLVTVLAAPAGAGRLAVYACLCVVTVVYFAVLVRHGVRETAAGLYPHAMPPGGLPVALGIVGAIVMPHNLLLHSSLARELRSQDVRLASSPEHARRLLRSTVRFSALALSAAFLVNCSIMSISARAAGSSGAGGLSAAYREVAPALGTTMSWLFALSLIAAGLASSVTGGMAAAESLRQLVPALSLSPLARRLSCLLPAAIVCLGGLPEGSVLVWSQVALSMVLPMVLFPLIRFASDPVLMGPLVIGRTSCWIARLIAFGVSALGVAAILCS